MFIFFLIFLLVFPSCTNTIHSSNLKNNQVFQEIPITSIQPKSWLRTYLETQRDGLTGHLDEMGGYPYDQTGWGDSVITKEKAESWWPWEQTGYWLDGMLRCGLLLQDEFLIQKARQRIRYDLEHPAEDGFIGPEFLRQPNRENRWVFAVYFRALMAEYSATGDRKILEAIRDHFLVDLDTYSYHHVREANNIEHLVWIGKELKDDRLLVAAEKIYVLANEKNPQRSASGRQFSLLHEPVTAHGVTYNEYAKNGAILYSVTGNETYLKHSRNAYRKIDEHYMTVSGVNSSTEILRGKDPLNSYETCDISAYTWSVGYLLKATGEAEWADKIEKAVFNAAPGSVTSNFDALQYFSCPNQVIATRTSNHNPFFRGNPAMQYTSNQWVKCCPGEVNRIMPNFASRLWMKDNRGGLVAAMYAPSQVTTKVGKKSQEITVVQDTHYPFSDTIRFEIQTEKPVRFPFTVRIPGWCSDAQIQINGANQSQELLPSTYITFERKFADGDIVTVILPQNVRLSRWPRNGIAVERGPLVYSLPVDTEWKIDPWPGRTPAKQQARYNAYPTSDWNYALALRNDNVGDLVQVVQCNMTDHPWSPENAPVALQVPARRVKGWKLNKQSEIIREDFYPSHQDGLIHHWNVITERIKGDYVFTPQIPDKEEVHSRLSTDKEMITLIPYGCAKLRLTIFPQALWETWGTVDW